MTKINFRARAEAAGYFVREGEYQGTPDNQLGRWYYGHEDDRAFRPYGAGSRTQREAWEAAWHHATLKGWAVCDVA